MSLHINDSGTWKQANNVFVKDSGVWKESEEVWIKTNGVWERVHLRVVRLTIAANTSDYNIRNAVVAAGWDESSHILANVTINSGVVVSSSNVSNFAITTGSSWPAGSEIIINNSGTIVGIGGRGGNGANGSRPGFRPPGYPGFQGGTAVETLRPTQIYNNGTMAGGGGGGGGGGGQIQNNPGRTWRGGGGGGGRSSNFVSTGGTDGNGTANAGGVGTFAAAGIGSTLVYKGGDGGNWGTAGFNGQAGQTSGGTGGAAGRYIVGFSNATFVVTGTRLGTTA